MTNKELYKELNAILDEARAKIVEAEKFAEKHQLEFSFGIEGAPEISYYPHSEQIRSERGEGFAENYMITDSLDEYEEEDRPKIEPLKKHRTDVFYGGYNYDNEEPFLGGWWISSRFC
jgi:hypothetical protein